MASHIEEALAAILTATYGEEVRQALYNALLEALTIRDNVETSQNKSQDIDVDSNSTTKYPSVKAVEDYLSAYYASAEDVAGQIEDINGRMELKENKSQDIDVDSNSTTKYPSVKAVEDYISAYYASAEDVAGQIEDINGRMELKENKSQDIDVDSNSTTKYPSVKAVVNKLSKYFIIDETTAEAAYRADNYKIIYLNATLRNQNKKAIVITLRDAYARQFGFCEDGSIYTRNLLSPGGSYMPESWANVNANILSSITALQTAQTTTNSAITALQNSKVDTETFTEFQETVTDAFDTVDAERVAMNLEISDVKAYIGYTDGDILGVCVDFENNRFTRLAGAVGLSAGADFDAFPMYGGRKRVVVNEDGEIDPYFDPREVDDSMDSIDVMVYQPKFYYKMVPLKLEKQTNGIGYHIRKANYYISATPHAGFKLHPLFYDANGNEIDYVLLSAYEASYMYWYETSPSTGYFQYFMDGADTDSTIADTDVLKSMPNVKPISSGKKAMTVDGMEQVAQQKSANWHLETIQAVSASQLLMLVEYAQFELQSVIGRGIVQHNSATGYMASLTGATALLGDASGMASETIYNLNGTDTVQTNNGKLSITYRGVENPWGNIWKQIQGVNIWGDGSMNGGQPYICTDFQFSSSKHSGNYVGAGFTVASASGYVSAFGYGSETFDWLFIASETVGNSSLPIGDNCYVAENNNDYRRVRYGGRSDLASTWTVAGAYTFAINSTNTNRVSNAGGRLLYVPDAKGVS